MTKTFPTTLALILLLTVVLFANQTRTNQSKLAQGVAALFNSELAQ